MAKIRASTFEEFREMVKVQGLHYFSHLSDEDYEVYLTQEDDYLREMFELSNGNPNGTAYALHMMY